MFNPTLRFLIYSPSIDVSLARPKSDIFATHDSVTNIFLAARSR